MCKIPKKFRDFTCNWNWPYQTSKSCMWGTIGSFQSSIAPTSSIPNIHPACVEVWDNHSGACHNVLLSFSQASHLVQGITTSKGQFLKMLKIQKLNISPPNRNESPASTSEQTSRMWIASPNLPASQTSKHQKTRPNLLSQLGWHNLRNRNQLFGEVLQSFQNNQKEKTIQTKILKRFIF